MTASGMNAPLSSQIEDTTTARSSVNTSAGRFSSSEATTSGASASGTVNSESPNTPTSTSASTTDTVTSETQNPPTTPPAATPPPAESTVTPASSLFPGYPAATPRRGYL